MSAYTTYAAMLRFQVRRLARIGYFGQLCLTAPIGFLVLKWMAARAANVPLDALAGWQAAVAGLWSLTASACGLIGFQRHLGVLEQQALSPLTAANVFTPVALAGTCLGVICLPVGYLTAGALGTVPPARHPLELTLSLTTAVIACGVSACTIAALFVLSREAMVFEELLTTPIWLLTGIVTTWDRLPHALQLAALFFPLTAALQATCIAASGGSGALAWNVLSLATSLVWLIASRVALQAALRRALVAGTLELA